MQIHVEARNAVLGMAAGERAMIELDHRVQHYINIGALAQVSEGALTGALMQPEVDAPQFVGPDDDTAERTSSDTPAESPREDTPRRARRGSTDRAD